MKSIQESFINNQSCTSFKQVKSHFSPFSKTIRSTRQFLQAIQSDPQAIDQLSLKYQNQFYRKQLKTSLHLTLSLIKLCGQKELLISKLTQEVTFLQQRLLIQQVRRSKKMHRNNISNENYSGQQNLSISTPNKKYEQGLQVQKVVVSSKSTHENSQFKKMIDQKEECLKIYKEENSYLREKLLAMTLKITQYQQTIQECKKLNANLQKEKHNLYIKLQQSQHCKILNFSPISKISQQGVEDEISFNQLTFAEKQDEMVVLKHHIEQLQAITEKLKTENQGLKSKLQSASVEYYQSLEKDHQQIKSQLKAKIEQIQKYRQLQKEISNIQKLSMKYLQENECLKRQIKQLKGTIASHNEIINQIVSSEEKCESCLIFKEKVESLSSQLRHYQEKYLFLKGKFQQIFNKQQNQRRQWDQIYRDFQQKKVF